jgi:hypothetical protein
VAIGDQTRVTGRSYSVVSPPPRLTGRSAVSEISTGRTDAARGWPRNCISTSPLRSVA